MKKKFLIIILFLISSFSSFAQIEQDSIRMIREHEQDSIRSVRLSEQQSVRNNNTAKPEKSDRSNSEYKACIYVSLGPSIATGDFAAADRNNDGSGYAKSGAVFDLGFTYKIDMNFGMVVVLRGMAHEIDVDKLTIELNKSTPGATYYSVKSDPWSTASIMVGAIANSSIDNNRNRFFVEGKVMLGLVGLTQPKQEAYVMQGGNIYYVQVDEADGSGFGFDVMAGLRYNASRRIALMFNVDYFGSKANFQEQSYPNSVIPAYSQKVSALSFAFGLGYMFR